MQVHILRISILQLAMIKNIRTYLLFILLFCVTSVSGTAQFINIQLTIEPELSTKVEQSLNFGTQVTGSGRHVVALGDPNMGVFSIKALYTQEIRISLISPDNLTSLESNAQIPIDLNIAYNNRGKDIPEESILLTDKIGYTTIFDQNLTIQPDEVWQELFVYVFGSIEIGNVPNANYEGDVILNVEYN